VRESGRRDLEAVAVTADGRVVPVRYAQAPVAGVPLLDILRVIGLGLIALIRSRRESGGRRSGSP
jgi:hypothetical protein